jgi:hypothetical protein
MRITLSKRVIIAVMAIAVLLSGVNTFMIFYNATILSNQMNKVQRDYNADDSTFDYVIFQENGMVQAKNQSSGIVDFSSTKASEVLNQAIADGAAVYVKAGNYSLNADVEVTNKKNLRIVGNYATILGNGHKIIVKGDDYTYSDYNSITGFTIINATLHIENSFATTITYMIFQNCSTALEFANTATWTEGTKIEECHFINTIEAIAFRTPVENGTGSYASSLINRCYFNLLDNSVGINIEPSAEYSDSQIENSRIWIGGQNEKTNQTGLQLSGSMFQTTLSSVVFESFAEYPENLYAISIGRAANTTPILGEGVSFLGNWTARVYNPASKWILGQGSLFRRTNIHVEIGANNTYGEVTDIHDRPLTISSFKPQIHVQGLSEGETITVRLRLEFVDNAMSQSLEKTFTNITTTWLTDDDMLKLFPSQNVVWAIQLDAKSNLADSSAIVTVDLYGVTT